VVGRDAELAALAAFLDVVPSGPCGFLLEGEAGIGKTSIWRVGAAWAADRSHTVLTCRPTESEAALSFAALGDLLDGVLDQVLPVLPSPQRRALEVALLREDPSGEPPEQRAISMAFLAALRHLCTSGPVVLAIDDLQWLDIPSAATVEFALRRLSHEPVGLLASVRDSSGDRTASASGPWMPTERITRLRVGPLAFGAFQSAVRANIGSGLSRLTIRRLFDAAGGNPFYGLELALAVQRAGAEPSPDEPLPVPADLHGVLRARLAALPDDAWDALLAAASLQSPTASMLEVAAGPSALVALQAAASQGVVEVVGDRVRFSHPLFASAIYSGAPSDLRRAVHWRLGEIAPTEEERARHLALSTEKPDDYVAGALDKAARAAANRGAPGVAAELTELAVRLTPTAQLPAMWRRRTRANSYLLRAGDWARAQGDLEALIAQMPAGRDRAQALSVLAVILSFAEGRATGIAMLDKALDEASADPVLQARIHLQIASLDQDDLAKCAMHAEAALAMAHEIGHPALVGAALNLKVYSDFLQGRGLDMELAERAVDLERAVKPARVRERAASSIAIWLKQADCFAESREMFEDSLQTARDEGDESSLPGILAHMADLECWAGNWAAAENYAVESWQAADQVEHRFWRTDQLYVRSLIDAHLGRVDAARTAAEEGLSLTAAVENPWMAMLFYGVLGFAELSAGNLAEAETSLSKAADLCDVIGLAEPAAWRFHANHIEVVIGLGDLTKAERLLDWFEERGRATGRPWTLATSARCRGLLLAARGDIEAAIQALDEALRHHQHLAMPFELGRTLLVTGQVQRRAKRKRIAKEHLERALAIFESLPAPPWAERARSELSRLGLRPPAPLDLTATEERIAALAASGHTNREVALALFLSTRTVEANLARVYRKLGISSRAELGAAMAGKQASA